MSSDQKHHEEVVYGLFRQLEEILNSSEQAIYIYLDDIHRICNDRFASLLGYDSSEEWTKKEDFADLVADSKSLQNLNSAYQDAILKKIGSTINVKWKKKSKDTVETTVIIVPISYEQHLLTLQFISEKK